MSGLKRYVRKLKKELACTPGVKRRMARHFERYMLGYSGRSREMSMEELIREFGPPEEVARNYMDCLTQRQKKRYRVLRWTPLLILALVVLSGLLFFFYAVWPNRGGYYEEGVAYTVTRWTPPGYFDSTELYPRSTAPETEDGAVRKDDTQKSGA